MVKPTNQIAINSLLKAISVNQQKNNAEQPAIQINEPKPIKDVGISIEKTKTFINRIAKQDISEEKYTNNDFDINHKTDLSKEDAKQYIIYIKNSITRGHSEKLTPFLKGEEKYIVNDVVAAYPEALFELLKVTCSHPVSFKQIINNRTFRAQLSNQEFKEKCETDNIKTPSEYLAEILLTQTKGGKTKHIEEILNDEFLRQKIIKDQPEKFFEAALAGKKLALILQYQDSWDVVHCCANNSQNNEAIEKKRLKLKDFMDKNNDNDSLNMQEIESLHKSLGILVNKKNDSIKAR